LILISKQTAAAVLEKALCDGADFSELYIEDTESNQIEMTDGTVKDAVSSRKHGAGIRVFSGVKSAYAYFGTEGATEIATAIDAIIGTGASSFKKVDGAGVGLTVGEGVTFVLDAEPKIRFYFAQGTDLANYSFKIGGVAQKFTATSEAIGETDFVCADISLFAYKMIGTVEVYNGSAKLGSFHINDYYDFALTQNNSALVDVVERFYMYCKSAGAYRDEVIGDQRSQ